MALKPLPTCGFYNPICNEKQKSFINTVKCSFSKILLIGDSVVSSLTRYPMIWLNTYMVEPHDTFNFGSSGDSLVLWRGQQRELLAELEIAVIKGKN